MHVRCICTSSVGKQVAEQQELLESAEIEDVNEADANSDDDDEEQHMLNDIEVDDMEVLMEDEDSSDYGEEEEDESEDMNVEMTRSSRDVLLLPGVDFV